MSVVLATACVTGYATLTQQTIVVNPDTHEFGEVTLGQRAAATLTISPGNDDDETITEIVLAQSCPDFSIDTGSLPSRVYTSCPPGDPCELVPHRFSVAYAPSVPGVQGCVVAIQYEPTGGGAPSTRQFVLSGTGVPVDLSLEVRPATIDFGDVGSGSAATRQITVSNRGARTLTLSGRLDPPYILSTGPVSNQALAPGASVKYDVQCTDGGGSGSALSLTTVEGPSAEVPLSCRNVPSTPVTINPIDVAFAPTLRGRAPPDRTLTVSAGSGSGNVTVANFRLSADASSDISFVGTPPASTTLTSGSQTSVTLRYAASTSYAGPLGTLLFDVNGVQRHVALSGDVKLGSIGANPPLIVLGPLCAGSSASRDVELYTNADGDVNVLSVTPPAPPFGATNVSAPLDGYRKSTLSFTTSITAPLPGELEDKVLIATSSPTQPVLTVPVRAIALPVGVAPIPELVRFGIVNVGTTASASEVTITNCTQGNIDLSGARIAGTNATEFAIVTPLRPVTLAPNQQERVLVVMTPRSRGDKRAELQIEYSTGVAVTALEGFGGDVPLEDRETYYGCSIGDPTSGIFVLLLVTLVTRRVRRSR